MTTEQAKLSGAAQDAFHYALLVVGNSLSAFYGDRSTANDAVRSGYKGTKKGHALYALERAIFHAVKAEIPLPFKRYVNVEPTSRLSYEKILDIARELGEEIRKFSIEKGWNAYNDAPLTDRPSFPTI